jgi:hypothetical protein
MDKVAIGRVVLTNREHIIALEPMEKGLVGALLRYLYEGRDPQEYFDKIQDVKVTKDMLDLAKHIVNQKSGRYEPEKFEDQYETALIDLINQKRSGKPITPKERPAKMPEVSAQLLCATPTAHWVEYVDWADAILQQPLEIADGKVRVPDRPGSGIFGDEAKLNPLQTI